ncbi:ABC transporter G family member 23-like isoform X2 [Rhodnius prolixus]
MPQEITLSGDLSIEEILNFYGKIYNMPKWLVKQRTQELITFLDLPPLNRQVKNCSGGQQRRISLAVTLIHEPDLLILDEPTVGVDPVLCAKIWECFLRLVYENNKTIIITTHYIQEAKNANTIGLMRSGVLLAEESPIKLLERYNCESLEDVFLKLSEKQEYVDTMPELPYPKIVKSVSPIKEDRTFRKHRFMAQIIKNYLWTLRNLTVTLFVCFVPALSVIIICSLDIDNIVSTPIAVVIPIDHTCFKTEGSIEATKTKTSCIIEDDLACYFIRTLKTKYPLEVFRNLSDARQEVLAGRKSAIVYLPDNYTLGLMDRLEKQAFASEWAIDHGTILVWADLSNFLLAYRILEVIYKNLVKLLEEVCSKCKIDLRFSRIPLAFQEPVYGSVDMKYVTYLLPGIMCPFVFYMTFLFSSTSIMMEKMSGQLERSQIAGLNLMEMIAAHIIIQFLIMCVQNLILFVLLYQVYDNIMNGSLFLVTILINFCEVLGMLYGVLVSLFLGSEISVAYLGIFTMLTSFALCGAVWPIEGQYWMVRYLSKLFPLTYSAQSYFNISVRGWGFLKTYVGFISTSAGITFLAATCYVLYRMKILHV